MGRLFTSGDWSGTLVALALIASDTLLRVMGKPTGEFDAGVTAIVAVYVSAHVITKAAKAINGRPTPTDQSKEP